MLVERVVAAGLRPSAHDDWDLSFVQIVVNRVLNVAASLLKRLVQLEVLIAGLALLAVRNGLRVHLDRGAAGSLRLGGLLGLGCGLIGQLRDHVVVAHRAVLILVERLHHVAVLYVLTQREVHWVVVLLRVVQ